MTCGNPQEYGISLRDDGLNYNAQVYYDIASWKNFGNSLLAVFQISTADTWGNHMYNLINASSFVAPFFFCFMIHMLGTYYIMNLTLIVIMETYIESKELYARDEIELLKNKISKIGAALPKEFESAEKRLYKIVSSPHFAQQIDEEIETEQAVPTEPRDNDQNLDSEPVARRTLSNPSSGRIEQSSTERMPRIEPLNEPEIEDRLEPEDESINSDKPPVLSLLQDVKSKSKESSCSNISESALFPEQIEQLRNLYKYGRMMILPENQQAFL